MQLRALSAAFVVLLVLPVSCGGPSRHDLDQTIEQAVEDWGISGLAVGIVKDGSAVHLRGYGYCDIEEKIPIDGDTIFGIGSTSKAFGAALIGVLVHEDKLDWEDKVIDHLPDFQLADPYVTRELTVRDLLCHRSGVQTNDAIFFGSVGRDEIVYKARFLEQVAGVRTRFDYHNIMILTAGQVAARVLGTTWDEAVQEKIFEPLGMDRSCTSISDLDSYTNVSAPHTWKGGNLVRVPWLNVDNTGPAGCINSSASDMARWIQAHLNDGSFDRHEIWGADVQREMFSPHTIMPRPMLGRLADSTHFGLYGLGWMMHEYRGKKLVYHGGATDGMGAFVAMVPEENLGVVVLSNTIQTPLLSSLGYRIIDAYLGVPDSEWSLPGPAKRTEGASGEVQEAGAARAPSVPLVRMTGVYSHPIFEAVEVGLENGKLVMNFDIYPTATLEHRDLDTFKMGFDSHISSMWDSVFGRGFDVTFHVDANAHVSELSISPVFGDFTRVECEILNPAPPT